MDKQHAKEPQQSSNQFPPVVAVLGHVDHGKTTLLDAIRKTSLAQRETGGITQKIGASSIEFMNDDHKSRITFIDTPGHEAFSQMRGRGIQAADVALLIVSSVDGVKPQTKESIEALKEAQTPFIVVLTKSDLPTANPAKAKEELMKEQIKLEGYGGDTPLIEVSAKTNHNIKELLSLILLMFDMQKKPDYETTISQTAPVLAIVIEAKLDTRAGPKATVIVKNGTIKLREELKNETQIIKVRTIINDQGKQIQSATVGDAVELLGFEKVPNVGSILVDKAHVLPTVAIVQQPLTRELVYKKNEAAVGISVILIADTQGSLEAIMNAFPKEIKIVAKKTGDVTEADILLAKSTGSIVLAFNTKVKPSVTSLAFSEKILLRNYEIIYELLDELEDALEGKLLSQIEQVYGQAKILAKFPYEKVFAFGIKVLEGRIARGDRLRIMRGEDVIGESAITSLRVGKDSTSKVEKGSEAGIVLSSSLDIQVGDMIISHS